MPASTPNRWPATLYAVAPWILATLVCLLGFVILAQFIATLHLSIQRGETLRATLAASEAAFALPALRNPDTARHP